jgi:hypothetical protein
VKVFIYFRYPDGFLIGRLVYVDWKDKNIPPTVLNMWIANGES